MLIEKRAPEELLAVRKENAAKLPVGIVVEHKTFGRGIVGSLSRWRRGALVLYLMT